MVCDMPLHIANINEALLTIARTMAEDTNDGDAGMNPDSSDADILEVLCDIAQGSPWKLSITVDDLKPLQADMLVQEFINNLK